MAPLSLRAASTKAVYTSELSKKTKNIIADMVKALAGDEHWRNVRFLRFDFSFEKSGQRAMWDQHLWDRATGENRVEWRNESNTRVVVLYNTNSGLGRAWEGEFEKTGQDATALVIDAQRRHANDLFWLVAPFFLADPRVKPHNEGTITVDGQDYDVLRAHFESVGLPPEDNYWFFVNQATHLVDRWAYFLKNFKGSPSLKYAWAWRFAKWQNVGDGLIVSTERTRVDMNWKVSFPVVNVLKDTEVPIGVFTDAHVSLPAPQPTAN
jgi:hypothetical protein